MPRFPEKTRKDAIEQKKRAERARHESQKVAVILDEETINIHPDKLAYRKHKTQWLPGESSNPLGRIPKYDKRYCEQVCALMRRGFSYAEIAAHFDVNIQTMKAWCKKYPEWDYAFRFGKELSEAWWTTTARENLENPRFNTAIWSQTMKSRFGWKDRVEVSGDFDNPLTFLIGQKPIDEMNVKEIDEELDRLLKGNAD